MSDQDDAYVDIQPWPVSELVGQLVTRVAVARRGLIEDDAEADVFERETDRFELDAWARTELTPWLLAEESIILEAPGGNLDEEQRARCEDAIIQASSIAWALGILPGAALPMFTDGVPERETFGWVPGPWTPIRNVSRGISRRTDEDLARERERWEIAYWRLHLPQPLDDESVAALADTLEEVREAGLLPITGTDIATDTGVPFGDLDAGRWEEGGLEAEIRLRTLNWVCGLGERIDTTPLIEEDE